MNDAANDAPSGQRDRSPAFPIMGLESALKRLAEFDTHFRRSPARPDKIGDAWNIKGKAYVDRSVAALKYFGLLEYQGSGAARQVVVSEEGRRYLRVQQEETRRQIIKAAALRPKQIAYFRERWGAKRPADAACIDELTLDNGFSDGGARAFLAVYDQTITFAGLAESDKNEADEDGSQPPMKEQQESAAQSQVHHEPARKVHHPHEPIARPPLGKPHIVMKDGHLDIHAAVDLAGLKKLQTMLKKYEEILEMMVPPNESEDKEGKAV
jgi:hypothetical protein